MNKKERVIVIAACIFGIAVLVGALLIVVRQGNSDDGEFIPSWAQTSAEQAQEPTSKRSATSTPARSSVNTKYGRWQEAFAPYSDDGTADRQAYDYQEALCQTFRDGGREATDFWAAVSPAQVLRDEWHVGDPSATEGSTSAEKAEVAEKVIIPILCPDFAHLIDEAKDPKLEPPGRIGFGNGEFLVGQGSNEVKPGTYTTKGQVRDCYWERSDSRGNILDNNFVSIAPPLTVTIYETDSEFTSQNCGQWTLSR